MSWMGHWLRRPTFHGHGSEGSSLSGGGGTNQYRVIDEEYIFSMFVDADTHTLQVAAHAIAKILNKRKPA